MTSTDGLDQADVAALIGLLVEVESAARTDGLPLDLALHVRRRLVTAGLLGAEQRLDQLVEALAGLDQRVRRLQAPDATTRRPDLPVENVLAFPEQSPALACATELRAAGADVDEPVHEPGFRRWTVVVRVPRGDGAHQAAADQAGTAIGLGGWHLGAR